MKMKVNDSFQNIGGLTMKFTIRKIKTNKFTCHVDQNC